MRERWSYSLLGLGSGLVGSEIKSESLENDLTPGRFALKLGMNLFEIGSVDFTHNFGRSRTNLSSFHKISNLIQ